MRLSRLSYSLVGADDRLNGGALSIDKLQPCARNSTFVLEIYRTRTSRGEIFGHPGFELGGSRSFVVLVTVGTSEYWYNYFSGTGIADGRASSLLRTDASGSLRA